MICPENFIEAIPGNINTLKLFDFTFAIRLADDEVADNNPISSVLFPGCYSSNSIMKKYSAPEVISTNKYDIKSEVWACGMTFYYLLYGDTVDESTQEHDFKIFLDSSYF